VGRRIGIVPTDGQVLGALRSCFQGRRGGVCVLTVVFLLFIAVFLISGVFISLEAKRRREGQSGMKAVPLTCNTPKVGRATPDND
jgi:hypothetical protein